MRHNAPFLPSFLSVAARPLLVKPDLGGLHNVHNENRVQWDDIDIDYLFDLDPQEKGNLVLSVSCS